MSLKVCVFVSFNITLGIPFWPFALHHDSHYQMIVYLFISTLKIFKGHAKYTIQLKSCKNKE